MNTRAIKTISAMDARRHFGDLMNRVSINGDEYIIKRAGKPLVRMSPIADPFENPFSTFNEWNDESNNAYDDL